MNNKKLKTLCRRVLACDTLEQAIDTVERFAKRLPQKNKRGTWGYYATRFVELFRADTVPHTIFAEGNSKLPFYSFSALPEFTCPGAGECLQWCYSFRAWRYPAAFFRQLSNTILLIHRPEVVANAFRALPLDVDVRLYVDGDFESVERVAFWMHLVGERKDLRCYGYSKSWSQLLEFNLNGGKFPPNYVLNISSGSKWESNQAYRQAVEALPISRGAFVAVPISGEGLVKGAERYALPQYKERVRAALHEQYGKRVFVCPGKCGSCGAAGHMCGTHRADDVVIGIGIH